MAGTLRSSDMRISSAPGPTGWSIKHILLGHNAELTLLPLPTSCPLPTTYWALGAKPNLQP